MKKIKIHYWSPFISKIATIKAVLNSAKSINKYSNRSYEPTVINTFGEFSSYSLSDYKNFITFKNLLKKNYLKYFSDKGYLRSRISWIFIFILTFFPLLKFLKREKPDFLVIHLLTIIPLLINFFFKIDTKIILRISGFPKLNFIRKFLWKILVPRVYCITCPTEATKNYIISLKVIEKEKIFYLADPIVELDNLKKKDLKNEINYKKKYNNYIFSAGRLTKQKNYKFLIDCFSEIEKKYPDLNLVIAGDGEQKNILINLIKKFKMEKKIFLIGYTEDVFNLMKNSICYVSVSLWEDPGFTLVEAISKKAPVISSDCNNGPKEILSLGNGGYLYKTNDKKDFLNTFYKFYDDHDKNSLDLNIKKINALKNIKLFTKFHHYKNFLKIITKS